MNIVLPTLQNTVNRLVSEFGQIPQSRHALLNDLASFIRSTVQKEQPVLLNFICTHNSRRSHLAQIWAQTAAHVYGINNVKTFSGGTEATAFNPRAVTAMKAVGFQIETVSEGNNPVYEVRYSADAPPLRVFSKTYDDELNPKRDFAAIMTCSDADENCPVVSGSVARIALTYHDPKAFDNTPKESSGYLERVNEIGREILFVFSQVADKK